MKLLAENRFTVTKELFCEGMRRVSRESYGKLAGKAMLVLSGIWLVLILATLYFGGRPAHALLELVILALLGIWLCELSPRNHARRAFRALSDRCGEDMERVTRFYRDHLELEGAGANKSVPYTHIDKILQTKHLLVLTCMDKAGILVTLDGFTDGSAEEVRTIILNRKNNIDPL